MTFKFYLNNKILLLSKFKSDLNHILSKIIIIIITTKPFSLPTTHIDPRSDLFQITGRTFVIASQSHEPYTENNSQGDRQVRMGRSSLPSLRPYRNNENGQFPSIIIWGLGPASLFCALFLLKTSQEQLLSQDFHEVSGDLLVMLLQYSE